MVKPNALDPQVIPITVWVNLLPLPHKKAAQSPWVCQFINHFCTLFAQIRGKKKQPTNNSLTVRRHRHADIMLDEVSERGIIYSTGLISECQTAIRTKIMLLGNCVYLCHGEPL